MKVYIIRDECTGYYHLGGNNPAFNDVDPPRFYKTEGHAKSMATKLRKWSDEYPAIPHDFQVVECEVTPLS